MLRGKNNILKLNIILISNFHKKTNKISTSYKVA